LAEYIDDAKHRYLAFAYGKYREMKRVMVFLTIVYITLTHFSVQIRDLCTTTESSALLVIKARTGKYYTQETGALEGITCDPRVQKFIKGYSGHIPIREEYTEELDSIKFPDTVADTRTDDFDEITWVKATR
jgi:hypothetical protein